MTLTSKPKSQTPLPILRAIQARKAAAGLSLDELAQLCRAAGLEVSTPHLGSVILGRSNATWTVLLTLLEVLGLGLGVFELDAVPENSDNNKKGA